jgi:hypothetical protein
VTLIFGPSARTVSNAHLTLSVRTPEARAAVRPFEVRVGVFVVYIRMDKYPPHEQTADFRLQMQLVEYMFSPSPASSVLASCLGSLSEVPE